MFALLFTLLAMCSTLVGGYIAIAARHRIHLLMGLAYLQTHTGFGIMFTDLSEEQRELIADYWLSKKMTAEGVKKTTQPPHSIVRQKLESAAAAVFSTKNCEA